MSKNIILNGIPDNSQMKFQLLIAESDVVNLAVNLKKMLKITAIGKPFIVPKSLSKTIGLFNSHVMGYM